MPQIWSEAELQRLIAAGQEETLQLEFKRSVATDDPAKTEISKDVSAFANTIGGTILYGISEAATPHNAAAINPIDPQVVSKEWLEQVINSRIQPRILGIRIHPIELPTIAPGRVAYAVEIPESSTAHQTHDHKYYRRFNFMSVPMADHEVRQAMNRVDKPAYQIWFEPYPSKKHAVGTGVAFRANVVNTSEVTPSEASAILYLPENAFRIRSDPWRFVSIGSIRFCRFEGQIHQQWSPGRPGYVDFDQAAQLIWQDAPDVRIHLKLFDNHGLALHESYDVDLRRFTYTVRTQVSNRKPAVPGP